MRFLAAIYPLGAHFVAAFAPTRSRVWAAGEVSYYKSEQFPDDLHFAFVAPGGILGRKDYISVNSESIIVNQELTIPLSELAFRFSRSGGPGGQHANRSATRVELLFDVGRSPNLTDAQREKILTRLGHLIDKEKVLHLTSETTRSQTRNRADVVNRLQALLKEALRPRKKRRRTRPSKAAKARRLEEKRRQSIKKQERRRPRLGDE
jgi:ribosome-associated protein